MAITRRQFVTRLSTLAAAMGASQVDLAKITEALAHSGAWASGDWTNKPKVVWVHGAECTGCSTSLLSLFEDVRGKAIEGTSITTLAALDLAVGGNGDGEYVIPGNYVAGGPVDQTNHPNAHRTLQNAGLNVDNIGNTNGAYVANIADVLIDFIDLQYHETVMGMGGDLAYQWLKDLMTDGGVATPQSKPFVLVVEGAIQPFAGGGFWDKTGVAGNAAWCSIGMGESGGEHSFDDVVHKLAIHPKCAAIIPIGQCATFGGYPGAVSPVLGEGQTGAVGTQEFLTSAVTAAEYPTGGGAQLVADKLINVPGCPTNPWWFILSVVAWLVDATAVMNGGTGPLQILDGSLKVKSTAVDSTRRLKAVYGTPLHGPYCTRYQSFLDGVFATVPGDSGCLQLLGCKGPQTMTLCGPHGWNSMNPRNDQTWDNAIAATYNGKGSNCIAAGHPCMSCTEKGYPDSFLPFVVR